MAFLELCFSGRSPWAACRLPFPLAAPPASFLTRTHAFPAWKRSRLGPLPAAPGDVQVFKQSPACSGEGESWACDPPPAPPPPGGQPVPAWWRCYPAAPGPAGPAARSLPAAAARVGAGSWEGGGPGFVCPSGIGAGTEVLLSGSAGNDHLLLLESLAYIFVTFFLISFKHARRQGAAAVAATRSAGHCGAV